MKTTLVFLACLFAPLLGSSQEDRLCAAPSTFATDSNLSLNVHRPSLSIDSLLQSINLPLNFTLRECGSTDCPGNAYATMVETGQRIIKYDDQFLSSLDRDDQRYQSLTLLAHEIGHHLAAHTLSLHVEQYRDIIDACGGSPFDKTKCTEAQRGKFQEFLRHRKLQESEADRFAGYIMHNFGVPLEEVLYALGHDSMSNENDDTWLTHPKRSKRLAAAEDGYLLAVSDKAHPEREINLVKIKGRSYDKEVHRTPEMNFAKVVDQVRERLVQAISTVSGDYNNEMTVHSSDLSNVPPDVSDRIQKYRNQSTVADATKDSSVMFQLLSMAAYSQYNEAIGFHPYVGCQVANDSLFLVPFYDTPYVIYSSPYDTSTISYPEIESYFVELIGMKVAESVEMHNENQRGVSKPD